jgi:cytochrome c oxidase subunit 2
LTLIELIWTITPALVLIAIAFPSFKLLYLLDEVIDPVITVKSIGNQWFWSYEYSDYVNDTGETIEFDSYMVPDSELEPGQLRLLEVDNRVILPVDTHIRFIVTARDVIHSFAVPSLGIKLDALPGRLNQTSVILNREGVFYGQCSELCGILHGFMPIVIQSVSLDKYLAFISSSQNSPYLPYR